MTHQIDASPIPVSTMDRHGVSSALVRSRPALPGIRKTLADRLSGPGGIYNIGNLILLAQGIGLQVLSAGPGNSAWSLAALADYFAGNGVAIAMTAATAIFLVGGEVYHRAWSGPLKPDPRLNRLGDFLSGSGAVILTMALFMLGHEVLALTSGLFCCLGKFGSAFPAADGWIRKAIPFIPDPFRTMVLASRVPALAAAGYGLCAALLQADGGAQTHWSTPATLVVCYVLWAYGDFLFFRSSRTAAAAGKAVA